MRSPYDTLPPQAFWRRAVAEIPAQAVDPVTPPPWTLSNSDRIATAGSCFAQHIARHLQQAGFNFLVTEPAHPLVHAADAAAFNYGLFTARTGNVYTARQLVQLFARAHGQFVPAEDMWRGADGSFIDPFRPRIQPGGFGSAAEFRIDRNQHFAALRHAFASLDVFVFTLGLTEAWLSRADGAVFPLCPGVAGGVFDPTRHVFHNFGAMEVLHDLVAFTDALRAVNPGARLILTVSPVPLVATATSAHVLAATTYSKSVLRVACEEMTRQRPDVVYFPSYEIITGAFSRGSYFAEDLRSVTEAGVEHVMRLFLEHFAGAARPAAPAPITTHAEELARLVQLNCDEQVLDSV